MGIPLRHLLIPPLFFARRKQWPSFAINAFLYGPGVAGCVAAALGARPLLILSLPLLLLCVAHIADAWRREKAAARGVAQPDRRLPFWAKLVKLALFLVSLVAIMVLLEHLATQAGTLVFHHMMRGFFFIPALFGGLLVAWIGGKLLSRLGSAQPAAPRAVRPGRS
ncbi:MAG TPA: hypothetical protein VID04_04370 [Methylomirabilota bacterium]